MRDNVNDRPIRSNREGICESKESPISPTSVASVTSPLRARFADDSGIGDKEPEAGKSDKHVLRQSDSNNSQTNNSMVSPKKSLNNQKSNNTIPSSVEIKTSTIRQHYYPEDGWGWVVVAVVFFCYTIQYGLQLSYGIFLFHLMRQPFGRDKYMASSEWITADNL